MNILTYKDGLVVNAGIITKDNDVPIFRITRLDGTETVRVGEDFDLYEIDENDLPEDYEDYKYYYRGFFELNALLYHNETTRKLKENQERISQLEDENQQLGDTLDDVLINIIPMLMGDAPDEDSDEGDSEEDNSEEDNSEEPTQEEVNTEVGQAEDENSSAFSIDDTNESEVKE